MRNQKIVIVTTVVIIAIIAASSIFLFGVLGSQFSLLPSKQTTTTPSELCLKWVAPRYLSACLTNSPENNRTGAINININIIPAAYRFGYLLLTFSVPTSQIAVGYCIARNNTACISPQQSLTGTFIASGLSQAPPEIFHSANITLPMNGNSLLILTAGAGLPSYAFLLY